MKLLEYLITFPVVDQCFLFVRISTLSPISMPVPSLSTQCMFGKRRENVRAGGKGNLLSLSSSDLMIDRILLLTISGRSSSMYNFLTVVVSIVIERCGFNLF